MNNTILNNHYILVLVSIIMIMNYRLISGAAFTLLLRENILESHLDSTAYICLTLSNHKPSESWFLQQQNRNDDKAD